MKSAVKKTILAITVVVTAAVLLAPAPRFRKPLSTVVEAGDGSLLGARIAGDGQWRFPQGDKVPAKFEKALLISEDRFFYYHPGINPGSILKALILNIKAGHIVSGGSTITMQVARMSGGNIERTYPAKTIEMLSALKLELLTSKEKILKMYVANAPFGGNTVGLEAASWRYTGKPPGNLTWAEAASLAVLPNSPGLIFPGRNQDSFRAKRDALLRKLYKFKIIDSLTLSLAIDEPLPGEPLPLPSVAPHLTDHFYLTRKGEIIRTTIDHRIQEQVNEILERHQKELEGNFINNLACLVVSVETGRVLAYAGNSKGSQNDEYERDVDMIRAKRSTGSILKPFLYAGMQHSGELLPNTIVPDIPTRFPSFTPENFDHTYRGAVTASGALAQSLNIPAVKMLRQYTPMRFLELLRQAGLSTFDKEAGHYGLSLILGGGETTLWELTGAYASLSRVLNHYNHENKYFTGDYHPPVLVDEGNDNPDKIEDPYPLLSASSIWLTFNALLKVNRPSNEAGWQYFSSSRSLAWKTGTSYGFRDAWAVGTTPEYVIGVWAGNADGEGRPGLTGISAAAPVLFDLINIMEPSGWFTEPMEDLTTIKVCRTSGYRAGPYCSETDDIPACVEGLKSGICPYHQIVHLNSTMTRQVSADCASPSEIKNVPWFVLPPAMEHFYRLKHPEYKVVPPVAEGCLPGKGVPVMEFIYPSDGAKIFIPRDHTGDFTRIIIEVAHRNPSKKLFWHLDENYSGTTRHIHQKELTADTGDHILTVVDEDGNTIKCSFTITGEYK
ncbi:MAG TPA: penicillin-binding protein 1C [Bacteroidales bacterium]|nr:penicillin-binding protein 1C [Bacteroidales bacterium]HPJ59984.1 penicillin-binding protein 1C [Bacteroidales bacterium]HPR12907.1 penicillin-binding protein 1C [Bacteroidales bacterium]